jgi:molybdenum cofactor cytidylyltransferase
MFNELSQMHGDKAVWKLLDRLPDTVVDVAVPGRIPPDVDTWDDYRRLPGAVDTVRDRVRDRPPFDG